MADDLTPELQSDAFETHAHRFTVIIARKLDAERRAVVDDVLAAHRPAHTIVDVCDLASGMRIGVGLYLELNTLIGRSGGFEDVRIGGLLGRHTVLGRREPGARLGHMTLRKTDRMAE